LTARPYRALRHRDFRRLALSQLVSMIGTQMQVLGLNWHVYLLTGSPLALGFVGLTRVLPIILFSVWGGILADRADRRRVLLWTQGTMALLSTALALVTLRGRDHLAVLYVLNALLAAAGSFDNPARQALIPRLVPTAELGGAIALNLTFFQTALIAGPGLAGLLIAGTGSGWLTTASAVAAFGGSARTGSLAVLYGLNALSYLAVLWAVATMRTSGEVTTPAAVPESPLASLRAGLRFVLTTPLLVWTTTLDFFATFFSGAMSLLPIVADRVLGVGAVGYGWLAAAPALGALVGSLYTSLLPLPRRQGPLLLGSVAAYGLSTVAYGLSRSFVFTFLALAGTGLADVVSTVIRQTLRQLITPDGLRGRMTGVNMIFFMGGPQLGELEAGLVASLFSSAVVGVTVSIVSGGLATLMVAAVVAAVTPVVRDYEQMR
jgi:MFS family permease